MTENLCFYLFDAGNEASVVSVGFLFVQTVEKFFKRVQNWSFGWDFGSFDDIFEGFDRKQAMKDRIDVAGVSHVF